jgi:DNA-binding transcriptional regulator YiaG
MVLGQASAEQLVPADAARLVGLRHRLGLSQHQLAEKVGAASKAVVYQWESGKRKPSQVFWLRIQRLQYLRAITLPDRYTG